MDGMERLGTGDEHGVLGRVRFSMSVRAKKLKLWAGRPCRSKGSLIWGIFSFGCIA